MDNIKNNILKINNNDKNFIDYENCIKIINTINLDIIKPAINIFYAQSMYFNFDDIKYIIESVYNKYITQYITEYKNLMDN